MSVQYATGFGGLNLVAPARMSNTSPWMFPSWDGISLKTQQGSSSAPLVYGYAGIVTDPTFPARHLFRYTHTYANSGPEFVGLGFSGAGEGRDGVVFGFTFTESYTGPNPSANVQPPYHHGIAVGTGAASKKPSASMSLVDPKECLLVLGDYNSTGTPPKYPLCMYGRNSFAKPSNPGTMYSIDQIHHVEVLAERSSKRVRVYVDDTLVQDFTFDGNLSALMSGLQIILWRDGPYNTSVQFTTDIGNVYLLSLDDVHKDRLGSSARVVDYAPASDKLAELRNSNENAAGNYQTADQMFDASSEYALMAKEGGSTDIYGLPQSLSSDAAAIHGVGIKVRALDIGGGGHKVASVSMSKDKQLVGPSVGISSDTQTVFSDASINPSTGAAWTVSDLSAGGIGFKGGFK